MTDTFKAIVVDKTDAGVSAGLRELTLAELPAHDVLVDVAYSTINYKDGLAVSGKAPICRKLPMVAGIDLAGTVVESDRPDFAPGERVLANGCGLSETHWGGYAQRQRVRSDFLVKVPEAFDLRQAMAIGTAGYTAMLCVLALEQAGVRPGNGPVLVTGAAGGVGSVAIALLAKLGFEVAAATGRAGELGDYLRGLGAAAIVDRGELGGDPKPLAAERWAAAIDVAGSRTLANVLSQIKYAGAVAACGLAQGADLPATVMPFILRGVTLIGVDSVQAPMARRVEAWQRLAADLDRAKLDAMTSVEPLARVLELAPEILAGRVRGRVVVDVNA